MNKKLTIIVIILTVVTVGLELSNIHLSGSLAADSVAVKSLQSSIAKLNEENQILNSKVLAQTSFEVLSSKAAYLGFVPNNSYISLRSPVKLSLKR